MGLDTCMKCIKYTLFIFNFFFWLVGVALLGFGLYALIHPIAKTNQLLGEADPLYPYQITLIVLGAVIMLLGFLGCCGAILENKCMLLTFFVLMTLVFLALVVAGLLVVIMSDTAISTLSKEFEHDLEKLVQNYKDGKSTANGTLDGIQGIFECCGINKGKEDFSPKTEPASCAGHDKEGCVPKLEKFFNEHKLKVIIVIFSVASIALIGMILSILLCCALRDEYDY